MPRSLQLTLATLLWLCMLPSPARCKNSSATPAPATVEGFSCSATITYPCQAYALYRAGLAGVPPDLSAVGDLFGIRSFTLADANNLSAPSNGQPLLVPLQCGCPSGSGSPNAYAYAPVQYQLSSGDTYWFVSSTKLQNLTQYQAVDRVNPELVPTNLIVGDMVTFPIFCQCPAAAAALVTYVMQQGDTYASIAADFDVDAQSLVSLNGPEGGTTVVSVILVPLRRHVPQWLPPVVTRTPQSSPASPSATATPGPSNVTDHRNGVVTGLAVGLGVVGGLCLLQLWLLCCLWRRFKANVQRGEEAVVVSCGEGGRSAKNASGDVGGERFLVSDMSEWLHKYKVFKVEELERGTGGFDDVHLIQGSVYKVNLGGKVFAVKKMKWDASEELKILQKLKIECRQRPWRRGPGTQRRAWGVAGEDAYVGLVGTALRVVPGGSVADLPWQQLRGGERRV